jgi:hypothetical protein
MNVERDERIIKLSDEGHAYSTIAERLGISRSAVSGVVFRHKHPDVKNCRRRMKKEDAA